VNKERTVKVTLDLDKLLAEGKINHAEYEKFSQLAARGTASLAFNTLIGFGVVAVSGASLALVPAPATAIFIGALVCLVGIFLAATQPEQWRILANICVVVGALLFGGGVIAQFNASALAFLTISLIFFAAAFFADNSLLSVLGVLTLSSCFGARTGYEHATYFLGIEAPATTVLIFTCFSIVAYWLSTKVPSVSHSLVINAARTGIFLVNFGFWIGSLWGSEKINDKTLIPDYAFGIAWALALTVTGFWAWQNNRRWLVITVAVFAAIHFYTQWFERLGASPATVLVAGLLALGFAIGLRALNTNLSNKLAA
jgi:hypothetical protein